MLNLTVGQLVISAAVAASDLKQVLEGTPAALLILLFEPSDVKAEPTIDRQSVVDEVLGNSTRWHCTWLRGVRLAICHRTLRTAAISGLSHARSAHRFYQSMTVRMLGGRHNPDTAVAVVVVLIRRSM